jgi:hypothetical protein
MTLGRDHVEEFARTVQGTLQAMFAFDCEPAGAPREERGLCTDKSLVASVLFTAVGNDHLYGGEYLLGIDDRVAASVVGVGVQGWSEAEFRAARPRFAGAIAETLNAAVGSSISTLFVEGCFSSFGAPRLLFGERSYPRFVIWRQELRSALGNIDCCFYVNAAIMPRSE